MIDEKPLVSIIVPVYNAEKYLPHCIESIQNQSYRNLEIILVDDGSRDSSPELCDSYAANDSRITVIHQENGGIAKAQNTGLDAAHGEYIAFADNDDILDRRNIELLLHALTSTGADMSKARWQQFGISQIESIREEASKGVANPEKKTTFKNPLHAYQTVFCKSLRLIGQLMGKNTEALYFNEANWCRLYKSELWNDIRFPEGMYAQDTAISGALYDRMNAVTDIDAVLYHWLQRPDSVTHKMYSFSFYHDHITAALINMQLCQKRNILPARSYYTLTTNLKNEKKSLNEKTDKEKYLKDLQNTKQAVHTVSLPRRIICLIYRQIRLCEKNIYDHNIKNMK